MARIVFIIVCGVLGTYAGYRFAKWFRGIQRRNHSTNEIDRMREDTNDRE